MTRHILAPNLALMSTAVGVIFASCSSPKYTYYFSTFTVHSKEATKEIIMPLQETGNSLKNPSSDSTEILDSRLEDSVSLSPIKAKKRNLQKRTSYKADSTKNYAAEVGFGVSLVSPPLVVIAAFTSRSAGMFFLGIPFAIIGITLSIIGLKSKKRNLAKAGLWIWASAGLVGLVVFFIALTAGGSS